MPTYPGNAYEILSQVRYGINEYSAALVQGTVTDGSFQNQELMRQINNAQYYLWSILFGAFPEYFLKSASITFTASVATLPSDCFKIRELRDSARHKIEPIKVSQRYIYNDGDSHSYYRYGNTLRIDADSITDTGTLWYYSRCRELDTGKTGATDTLATTAKAILSYYNGMLIENFTDSTVGSIATYSAARLCTFTDSLVLTSATDYYGIVTDLPEIFQPLIAEYAVLQLKKSPKVPMQVTKADVQLFNEMLSESLKAFAGTQNTDTYINDVVNDFEG